MKSWRTLIHLPVRLHYVIKWANVQQTNGTRTGAPQNWQTSGFLPCTNVIFQNINTLPKTPRLADAVSPGGCVFVIVFTDKRDSYSAVVSDQFKQVEFSFKSRVNRANQKPLYALGLFSLTYRVSDSKNLNMRFAHEHICCTGLSESLTSILTLRQTYTRFVKMWRLAEGPLCYDVLTSAV